MVVLVGKLTREETESVLQRAIAVTMKSSAVEATSPRFASRRSSLGSWRPPSKAHLESCKSVLLLARLFICRSPAASELCNVTQQLAVMCDWNAFHPPTGSRLVLPIGSTCTIRLGLHLNALGPKHYPPKRRACLVVRHRRACALCCWPVVLVSATSGRLCSAFAETLNSEHMQNNAPTQ